MGKHKVLQSCSLGGKAYSKGESIELTPEEAAALGPRFLSGIADKQVKKAEVKSAPKKAAKKEEKKED